MADLAGWTVSMLPVYFMQSKPAQRNASLYLWKHSGRKSKMKIGMVALWTILMDRSYGRFVLNAKYGS